jgi:adenylate cyclase
MPQEGFKRKLTAILSADVAGYSRLMEDNEEATIQTLNTYRNSMTILIRQHKGRVVDTTGDNLMAEFSSVVDSVNCAVAIQRELAELNTTLPKDRNMEFRIGVNVGDVVEEGDRIYGDGVNIAARVESMSEAGGVCISGAAYDQIANKLELEYENLGEHKVKNINTPIRVYRILLFADAPKPTETVSLDKMKFSLPARPSIAVLPFDNMSSDRTQEYIADGITENIITALSKVPNLFVIARNSSFTYKGTPVKVQQVSEEMGVRYVLEGSVQKSGDRIRITAQLIDAIKGHHLWAEKYDRKFNDIFALQDDITLNILKEMHVELTGMGGEFAKGTDNPEAYLKFIKGLSYFYRYNKRDNAIARNLFEEAIALDPSYAAAFHLAGDTYYAEVWALYSKDVKASIAKVEELAQKALALAGPYAGGHYLMSVVYRVKGQINEAIAEGERAIALDPNGADIHAGQVQTFKIADRTEKALKLMKKAMRLNPKPLAWYYWMLGSVYHVLGRYEDAIEAYERIFSHETKYMSYVGHVGLTFAHLELGQEAEARIYAAEALKIRPDPLIIWATPLLRYKDMTYLNHLTKPLDSLQRADARKREL